MKIDIKKIIREEIDRFISEGGNVFPESNSFVPKAYMNTIIKKAMKEIGLSKLKYSTVGNTSKKILGDIDLALDSKELAEHIGYKGNDVGEFFDEINKYLSKKSRAKKYKVLKGLKQFHTLTELIDNKGNHANAVIDRKGTVDDTQKGWIQMDFFVGDLDWMNKFLTGATKSKYKMAHRNNFIIDIFSQLIFSSKGTDVKKKFQVNLKNGVELVDFIKDNKGKRVKLSKKLVIDNPDKITKFLFGRKYSFKDIDTFEKLYELFMSNSFKFPNHRNKIIDAFKKSVTSRGYVMPTEIE